jgi:hypothetical protein
LRLRPLAKRKDQQWTMIGLECSYAGHTIADWLRGRRAAVTERQGNERVCEFWPESPVTVLSIEFGVPWIDAVVRVRRFLLCIFRDQQYSAIID